MNPPLVNIHTHDRTPQEGVIKVYGYLLGRGDPLPEGKFTAGVHPWDVGRTDFSTLDFFDAPPAGMIGIGEIGLDFAIENADQTLQAQWLDRQLAAAERLRLPVVLHCVKAFGEMLARLKNFRLKGVVFHGFTGSPELARQLTEQGYCLSFGVRSMHSPKTVEALRFVPPETLFLETDDDLQTGILTLYDRTAAIREASVDELKETIFNNYKRIFND